MLISWRTPFIAAACALILLMGPAMSRAEDAADQPAAAAQLAPADQPAEVQGMPGCPHSDAGACCGTCQEKAAQGQPAHDPADCPCKHAKKAQQDS